MTIFSSNIKEYPQDAPEIRQLVDNRRHYLNIIYATSILATFQVSTSLGWYVYLVEAYAHLAGGLENIIHNVLIIVLILELMILYLAIYSKRSAFLVCLIVIYFLQCAGKLLQIAIMYPQPAGYRQSFKAITRYSEYDAMSLTYDSVMFVTSLINCLMCCCATWHFTPLVIVKMNYKQTEEDAVARAMKKLKKTKLTTYDVCSSDEESAHRISRGPNGKQFISKNQHKKTFSTQITDKADVTVTTSGARSTKVR
ncbi:hypothetical protein GCK72_005147 [Caenorhabditis remanei]|uniref:Uncharacterized protein n=1 Tax=Caenorhabditis remanei TaxID=31234 RepID=A0A6A5HD26_CAERE|nr:hypothetical protein GCK72_005147 [Caenorhabditis remanei]KAF1765195.1 hypothetical protein GCK72_005147 [Caenorhabditis remanei]